jgi:uncharacterized membrane protein YpjA
MYLCFTNIKFSPFTDFSIGFLNVPTVWYFICHFVIDKEQHTLKCLFHARQVSSHVFVFYGYQFSPFTDFSIGFLNVPTVWYFICHFVIDKEQHTRCILVSLNPTWCVIVRDK